MDLAVATFFIVGAVYWAYSPEKARATEYDGGMQTSDRAARKRTKPAVNANLTHDQYVAATYGTDSFKTYIGAK